MERIITISLAADLIKKIGDHIEDEYLKQGKDLGRLAFVFGGRRPALFLRRELSERIGKSFFPPRFFSLDEFVREAAGRVRTLQPLSEMDAAYLIYRIARSDAPSITADRPAFAQFLPWAREILAFIDQVDMENVTGDLLRNVQHNAVIGYEVPENINVLLRHISVIRDAFHAAMEREKKYSRGYLYLTVANRIGDIPFSDIDTVYFCNLFYLSRTEQTIVKALYDAGKAAFFFQGDHRDWPVLEETSRVLGKPLEPAKNVLPHYQLNLYAGFDTHSQVALVREIVKKIERPEKAVLVVPDPDALIPVLSEVAPLVKELNVSLGYPFRRSSIYSLLECIFRAQETRRDGAYYAIDYIKAISHPLVKNLRLPHDPAVTRVLVHKMEEILVGIEESPFAGSLFIKPDEVKDTPALHEATRDILFRMDKAATAAELQAAVAALNDLLFFSWEKVETFADFCAVLERFLDTLLEKSFISSYPLNVRAAERLLAIIEELRQSSFAAEKFGRDDIFRMALDRLGNELVSFTGSPLKGFQVLGFLEARSLNFEDVVVMDVNESVLPNLHLQEPLIPREVMLTLGLSRPGKEEEIQRYQFMRLITAAKNVHLVYADAAQKEKSRFIEELVWQRQKEARSLDALPVLGARFGAVPAAEKGRQTKTAEMAAYLRTARYSATKLNMYLECPMRFYFRYILGLEEKEDLLDEPEGVEIGNFVHDFLNIVFLRFTGKKPVIDADFENYFFTMLDDMFKKTLARKMKADAFLVKEILDHRMKEFLANEKTRQVEEIVCLEKTFTSGLTIGGSAFTFNARVDRIDRLTDGSLLIIDYKTGSSRILPGKTAALEAMEMSREAIRDTVASFQLPLYVQLAGQTFRGSRIDAALYDIRAAELKQYFQEADDDARQVKTARCAAALEHIVQEIVDPAVPFVADDADRDRCANCPFFYACR